jgi:hypothetical protein
MCDTYFRNFQVPTDQSKQSSSGPKIWSPWPYVTKDFFLCYLVITSVPAEFWVAWSNPCTVKWRNGHRSHSKVNDRMFESPPGANPTIASYNASVVNFYNATGSLARFENKNIIFYFSKHSSLLQRWRCSWKFKNRRIGSRCSHWIQCTADILMPSVSRHIHRRRVSFGNE